MTLVSFWFIVVALLWIGFLVLEGFDFGVGMLHGVVGRDEGGRRAAINTIGPLWDGNEVWLIVAAAAIFAAFPGWYATMFSALYLALVLLLVALIVRGVSFEYRGKSDRTRWIRTWDGLMTGGSLVAPFLIGVALGDLLHGLPIDKSQNFTGSFLDLLPAYSLFVGLTLVLICVLHGATFLALKTTGDIRDRAHMLARRVAPITALAVLGFVIWTQNTSDRGVLPNIAAVVAIIAAIAAMWLTYDRQEGWAFAATTVTMAASIGSLFIDLYPKVIVSTTNSAYNLTAQNTAAGSYALKVMTVVAAVLVPVVIAYQAWTYHVFRRRVSSSDFVIRVPESRAAPSGGAPAAGGGG